MTLHSSHVHIHRYIYTYVDIYKMSWEKDFTHTQKRFLNVLVVVFASLSILGLLFIILSYVLLEITRNQRRKRRYVKNVFFSRNALKSH